MKVNGGEHHGSIEGGVHGVNAAAEGGGGEIGCGRGFWPPKLKTESAVFGTGP